MGRPRPQGIYIRNVASETSGAPPPVLIASDVFRANRARLGGGAAIVDAGNVRLLRADDLPYPEDTWRWCSNATSECSTRHY